MPSALHVLNQEVILCRRCPRLVEYRETVGREKRRAYLDHEYWAKPVPGFGDPQARVVILGLAPGAHGSNRTGRPFTGDSSGRFMYPSFTAPASPRSPMPTAATTDCACWTPTSPPPCAALRPRTSRLREEIANCAPFLDRELQALEEHAGSRRAGQDRLRCLPESFEANRRADAARALQIRSRRQLPDAERSHAAGFLPSFEPEHCHREADGARCSSRYS